MKLNHTDKIDENIFSSLHAEFEYNKQIYRGA